MKIIYPWLNDPYFENENERFSKRNFLKKIDGFLNQRQYFKLTLLNWEEKPIKDIQGEIVSGSLTKDGSSAVRRTCNLSCSVSRGEYDPAAMSSDYSINKKIFLEIGVKNETEQYKEYPILWFPQGVFFITSFSMNSSSSSAVNISLGLKDKMAMLDGTVGGKFPSSAILDTEITQMASGETVERKVRLNDLIVELVNHFGGEHISNIVVEDIPNKIGRYVRWMNQEQPLYLYRNPEGEFSVSLEKNDESLMGFKLYRTCESGDDIGYVYEDFVYTGDFTVSAGSTITSALDTIKNYLGNFEYFYDEFGIFHFREIKNYLNNSKTKEVISEMNENNYLMETSSMGKSIYTFADDVNLISISNNPQYENIRNDFIVHGIKKSSSSNIQTDVMYHLAIDKKPEINLDGYGNILVYKDPYSKFETLTIPKIVKELPGIGDDNFIYGILDKVVTEKFEVEYTKEELRELEANGKLSSVLEKKDSVSEALLPSDDGGVQKDLINNITFLTEAIIDSLINSADSLLDEKLNQDVKKYVDKINNNQLFKDILNNKPIAKTKLDTYLIKQTTLLKSLIEEYPNDGILEICNKILNSISVENNDETQSENNKTGKYDIIINSLRNQERTCDLLINQYITMNKDGNYTNAIDLLKKEKIALENQIKWYEARGLLQDFVSDKKTIEKIPTHEEEYQILKGQFYYWDKKLWKEVDWLEYYNSDSTKKYSNVEYTYETINKEYESLPEGQSYVKLGIIDISKGYVAKDWRTEIILQGLQSKEIATDNNSYYYEELISHWPSIYNLYTQKFRGLEADETKQWKSLCDGYYFLDFIEPSSNIYGDFSVSNIGRRQFITNSNDINCLFEPDTPDIGFVIYAFITKDCVTSEEVDSVETETKKTIIENGLKIVDIPIDRKDLYENFMTGGIYNAAFPQIKYDLLTHTKYQNTLSLSAIPVWYLEPNNRISIFDNSTNTFGEYIIHSISYTLGVGNPMTVNCSEVTEKM